jgi:hypothetical protein
MKKINNANDLEREKLRLQLRQEKLLKDIRHSWSDIKMKGDPGIIATEMVIDQLTGGSDTGRKMMSAAELIINYLKKRKKGSS